MYIVMKYLTFFLCIVLFLTLIPMTQAYEAVNIYKTGNNRPILDLELAPNGEDVIATDGSMYLLNFNKEEVVTQGWAATTLDISDDGSYIVTGSEVNICLFTNDGERLWCDVNFPGGAKDITISDDKTSIIVGSDAQGSISRFNLAGEQQWTRFVGTPIYSIVYSSKLGYVVSSSYFNHFCSINFNGDTRFNYENGDEIYNHIFDIAISEDGRYIVGGLDSLNQGKVMQFSSRGYMLWEYTLDGFTRNVAISADGSFVAAGTHNILEKSGSLYYFSFNQSTSNGTLLWNTSVGSYVDCLDMIPDGSYLAIGLRNNHIQLYSQSGEMILDHAAHDGISTITLSKDGRYLVAGTRKGEIYYIYTGILPPESTSSNIPSEIISPTPSPISTSTVSEESLTPTIEPNNTIPNTLAIQENVANATHMPERNQGDQFDISGGSGFSFGLISIGLIIGAFFFLIRLQRKDR
jgi:WD40 repeat protein